MKERKSVKSTVLNTHYSGVLKCGLLISVKIGMISEQEVKQRLLSEMPLFSTLSDNALLNCAVFDGSKIKQKATSKKKRCFTFV